jgi:hypothetical protein
MSEIKPMPDAQSAALEQEKWESRYEAAMARVREIARPHPGDPQRSPEEVMEFVRALAEESRALQPRSEEELWRWIAEIARGGPATLEQ